NSKDDRMAAAAYLIAALRSWGTQIVVTPKGSLYIDRMPIAVLQTVQALSVELMEILEREGRTAILHDPMEGGCGNVHSTPPGMPVVGRKDGDDMIARFIPILLILGLLALVWGALRR
ncbi:MAG: hypothetical protein AABY22_05060, partial [Nanoarchaeota archaeon]